MYYYPYAGRLFKGPNNKIMVDCGSQGILFIEADAEVAVEMLGDRIRPPCQYADEFLLDMPGSQGILGCPLMLFQVTLIVSSLFFFLFWHFGNNIFLTLFMCYVFHSIFFLFELCNYCFP